MLANKIACIDTTGIHEIRSHLLRIFSHHVRVYIRKLSPSATEIRPFTVTVLTINTMFSFVIHIYYKSTLNKQQGL